jgi:hypothetical protein
MMALLFIVLFDYTILRLATLVFFDNVRARTFSALSVFKCMNTVATLLPYNYIE